MELSAPFYSEIGNTNGLCSSHIDNLDTSNFKTVLFKEILNCQYRCLTNSALWLTELLNSRTDDISDVFTSELHNSLAPHFIPYSYAKALFDKNEFKRCAHHLRGHLRLNPIIDFIYFYARFKAALKYMFESESDWVNNESQRFVDDLVVLKEDIEEFLHNDSCDPYILYLYGMVLKRVGLKTDAREALIKTLRQHEYLWSAWFELTDIVSSDDCRLPSNNWMRSFFEVKCLKQLHLKEECDKAINCLMGNGFDQFDDLRIDLAVVNEYNNNSVYALELLTDIYKKDPFRMDYFITYSNILFLQEKHELLSELTQNCIRNDRYREETCCVVANFYSLRTQHDKAILYFQRALKLNPSNSMIWLLAAHEYTELENYHAAVRCYWKSIEYNELNHRAFYGLGQLYEIFTDSKFALTCYKRAFELLPGDSRILVAMGSVYEKLARFDDAKICFHRAYAIGDVERTALIKLGKVLEKQNEVDNAAAVYNLFVDEFNEEGFSAVQDLGHAYIFLANYHWTHTKNLDKARGFATKCGNIPEFKTQSEDLFKKMSKGNSSKAGLDSPFGGVDPSNIIKVASDENMATVGMCISEEAFSGNLMSE